jgi:hypothetical protein
MFTSRLYWFAQSIGCQQNESIFRCSTISDGFGYNGENKQPLRQPVGFHLYRIIWCDDEDGGTLKRNITQSSLCNNSINHIILF